MRGTFVQTTDAGVAEVDVDALAAAGAFDVKTNSGPPTPTDRKATIRRRRTGKSPRSWAEATQARFTNLGIAPSARPSVAGSITQDEASFITAASRRAEISAEPYNQSKSASYRKTLIEKSDATRALVRAAVDGCLLFSELSEDGRNELVDAFTKMEAKRGELLTEEGEWGDLFYVLESGQCDAFKMVHNPRLMDMVPTKVKSYEAGGSFGDLALMYNVNRAATVRVVSEKAVLWTVDRATCKNISVHFKVVKQKLYEDLLRRIPLLQFLTSEEMLRLVDAAEEKTYSSSTIVLTAGAMGGEEAYVVMDGKLVYKTTSETGGLALGDVFGVEALSGPLHPRGMTVTVSTPTARVLTISRLKIEEVVGCPAGSNLASVLEERKDRPASVMPVKVAPSPNAHRYHINMKLEDLETNMRSVVSTASPSSAAVAAAAAAAAAAQPRTQSSGSIFSNTNHEGEIVLGVGTFGKVIIVRHSKTGATYAMKRLNKQWIVENGLETHVVDERNVMTLTDHPFVLKLHNSYWDERYVYLVLELCLGGELFAYLRKASKFTEQQARFYVASVTQAFDHLHSKSIIYRDLKPENLMLDDAGFLKVVDFGLAKVVKGRTWTICGTPEYLAPEVVLSKGHNKGVDYWALGVLVFELVAGYCPFVGDDNMQVYKQIVENHPVFPVHMTPTCRDLIRDFTKSSLLQRLGLRRPGVKSIRDHPWFEGFDWAGLDALKIDPPIVPKVRSRLDTSNFEEYIEEPGAVLEAAVSDWRPSFPFEVVNGLTLLA